MTSIDTQVKDTSNNDDKSEEFYNKQYSDLAGNKTFNSSIDLGNDSEEFYNKQYSDLIGNKKPTGYVNLNTEDSTTGAFVRGIIGNIGGAAGTIIGGTAGATAGASVGEAYGILGGGTAGALAGKSVFGTPGAIVGGGGGAIAGAFGAGAAAGGIAGGLAGGAYGGEVGTNFENWALSKIPESWRDAIGQSPDQKMLDQLLHPDATFAGGLVPFALTANPFSLGKKLLPEAATYLQKTLANPITSKLISGSIMGGFEASQEIAQGEYPDWSKIGISTAFGMIFNNHNKIGTALENVGNLASLPVVKSAEKVKNWRYPPTLAEASDLNLMGPGVTREVSEGMEKRNPVALQAARDAARQEKLALGIDLPELDIHEIAYKLDPEIIERHDDLVQQKEVLSSWLEEHKEAGNLESEEAKSVSKKLEAINQDLTDVSKERANIFRNVAEHIGDHSFIYDENKSTLSHIAERNFSPEVQSKVAPENRPLDVQRKEIVKEISQNLMNAGRDINQSMDTASVIAEHLITKAYRFEGKRGTAEDIYREIFPGIGKHETREVNFPAYLKDGSSPKLKWDALVEQNRNTEKESKNWNKGDVVDAGNSENSLVLSQDNNGNYELISSPDNDGKSNLYKYNESSGLEKIADKEDFNSKTKNLIDSEKEKVLEQRRKKEAANGYIENLFNEKRSAIYLAEKANPSTFIHEMSHQWLEDLMSDARHPDSPELLKDDAKLVLQQLGLDNYEDIKRKHHEQFANWGEQYMREGISPSRKLDRIFGQFKNWLTSVYETIRQLGKPITPEIRGVFDRLLASNPESRIIVPENVKTPTLSDIHEADSQEHVPHPDAPEMDRLISESTQFSTELPKEIKNEIEESYRRSKESDQDTKPVGKGSKGKAKLGGLDESIERPSFIPESNVGGETNGKVSESSSGYRGEVSEGISGRSESGETGKSAESVSGKSEFGTISPVSRSGKFKEQGRYVTKAGNLVLENLNTTKAIEEACVESAERNDDFNHLRKPFPPTGGELIDLADDLNVNVDKMKELNKMSSIVSRNIVFARNLLKQSASEFINTRDKALASGSDADLLAWAEVRQRHDLIQGYLAGITSNVGRSLSYFRKREMMPKNIENFEQYARDTEGKTLYQLRQDLELSKNIETTGQVSKFTQDSLGRKIGNMTLEYFTNNLISGIKTHTTYLAGNFLLNFSETVPEKLLASYIGNLRNKFGREGEAYKAREALEFFDYLKNGLPGSLKSAKEAFIAGAPVELPSETAKREARENNLNDTLLSFQGTGEVRRPVFDEAVKWKDMIPDIAGYGRGIMDSFLVTSDIIKNGALEKSPSINFKKSNLGSIPDIEIKGLNILPIGTAIRLPSRIVSAIHSFFTTMHYSINKNSWALREAMNDPRNLEGSALDKRISELANNPPLEKMQEFHKEAYEAALMGEGGRLTKAISTLANTEIFGLRPLRFVSPFNKIFSNIVYKSVIERSPAAFLSSSLRDDLLGKNGNLASDRAISRMMFGSAVYSLAATLYHMGGLTDSGPNDPNKRRDWLDAGYQPHSIKIGSMYYDIGKLGPLGKILSIGSDLASVAHSLTDAEYNEALHKVSHAMAINLVDESPLGAFSHMMKAIEDPGKHGSHYIEGIMSGFLPYSSFMYQTARSEDTYVREAHSFVEELKKRIPGLSETLLPKRDIWGEPIKTPHDLGYITSVHGSVLSDDPVRQYLSSSKYSIAPPERKINKIELTPEQYDEYCRISGRTSYVQMSKVVRTSNWEKMSDIQRHDFLVSIVSGARNAAQGEIIRKDPSLITRAVENEKRLLRGE